MVRNKKKRKNDTDSEEDEDDTFFYRFPSTTPTTATSSSSFKPQNDAVSTKNASTTKSTSTSTSGGIAPSKSTLYVSNLDYTLTNSDLHTLFSTFGKVARVTVPKPHRFSGRSTGVAFVQFVTREAALSAASVMDRKILNGRTITASIAVDNGRAAEFIKKRVYRDKSRCYECGESGHLSYECPRNQLGPRDRPPEKKRGRRGRVDEEEEVVVVEEVEGEGLDEEDNWASVVDGRADERLLSGGGGGAAAAAAAVEEERKKKAKKASYFSDESGDDEEYD